MKSRSSFQTHRKAQGLAELFAILLAFAVILVFSLLGIAKCSGPPEQKISDEFVSGLKIDHGLNAYLNTPVEYEGSVFSSADLISLAINDEIHRRRLVSADPLFSFTTLDKQSIKLAFDTQALNLAGNSLSLSALDFMRSYSGSFENYASNSAVCSFVLYAESGSERITIYKSDFNTQITGGCPDIKEVASSKIPGGTAGNIDVRLEIMYSEFEQRGGYLGI